MFTAANISGFRYTVVGGYAVVTGRTAWGVTDAAGRALSMNGADPATWSTRSAAEMVAAYPSPKATWVAPL